MEKHRWGTKLLFCLTLYINSDIMNCLVWCLSASFFLPILPIIFPPCLQFLRLEKVLNIALSHTRCKQWKLPFLSHWSSLAQSHLAFSSPPLLLSSVLHQELVIGCLKSEDHFPKTCIFISFCQENQLAMISLRNDCNNYFRINKQK